MDNKEYADSLRKIADLYEHNPELHQPEPEIAAYHCKTKEDAKQIIAMLGNCEKQYTDTLFTLSKKFGGINLRFVFSRTDVCDRVISTRTVEVEVVEWKYDQILKGDDNGN
ncbi:MAG: hypothetical protein SFW66_09065 [Gammaproteobacteria bacterium]|nr:hypothetical protein [Gammaproteobacteria bacterium]